MNSFIQAGFANDDTLNIKNSDISTGSSYEAYSVPFYSNLKPSFLVVKLRSPYTRTIKIIKERDGSAGKVPAVSVKHGDQSSELQNSKGDGRDGGLPLILVCAGGGAEDSEKAA